MPPPSKSELDTKQRLTADLAEAFITIGGDMKAPHRTVLHALLVAYISLAEVHSCCTGAAAAAALRAGDRLRLVAEGAPATQNIH